VNGMLGTGPGQFSCCLNSSNHNLARFFQACVDTKQNYLLTQTGAAMPVKMSVVLSIELATQFAVADSMVKNLKHCVRRDRHNFVFEREVFRVLKYTERENLQTPDADFFLHVFFLNKVSKVLLLLDKN
jgi:hypothetical protein